MKCKFCPRKKICMDECYGELPCDFALAFDKLARRIDLKDVCIESLKSELATAARLVPTIKEKT